MLSSSNMSGCGEQQLPAASSVVNNPYKRRQHATSDSEETAQKRQTLDQDGVPSPHDDTLPSSLGPSHDCMDVGESRIRNPPSDCNNDDEEMSSFDQAPQDEEDDATTFELDFALCPEVGAVTSKLSRLNIQEEEVGDEQQVKAIHHAQSGDNMFLTGKAGTGKSWTSRQIKRVLSGKRVWFVAPTGVAAINIDGVTIHAFGGFGMGNYYSDFDRMLSKENRKRIACTDALLFDEISMCSGHLFDVLECMITVIRSYDDIRDKLKELSAAAPVLAEHEGGGRGPRSTCSAYMLKMRWKDEVLKVLPPWGGMQIICVGDFFQLPPVPNRERGGGKGGRNIIAENDELLELDYNNIVGLMGTYAFQSEAWWRTNFVTIELTEIHRQKNDMELLNLLNDLREGKKPLHKHDSTIQALKTPVKLNEEGIIPTELHSRNAEVDSVNKVELDRLNGQEAYFAGKDSVQFDEYYKTKLIKKWGLQSLRHLPQLWSSVEDVRYPPRYHEATAEADTLEKEKKRLIESREYEKLADIDAKIDRLKKEADAIKSSVEDSNKFNIVNVESWLKESAVEGSSHDYLDRIIKFDRQLLRDFKRFSEHANERYFSKECRVSLNFAVKDKAQVMLTWNLDLPAKLANGSRGIVAGFVETNEYRALIKAIVDQKTAKPDGSSDHQAVQQTQSDNQSGDDRSSTLSNGHDGASKSTNSTKPSGGEDALLSLITSLDKETSFTVIRRLMGQEFLHEELAEVEKAVASGIKTLPLVRFLEGQLRIITPKPFSKEFRGCGTATRWQLPLQLAWAISIHKSQGMTLDYMRTDLSACFAAGQAYVACSRGRGTDSMQVLNFSEEKIITSELVKSFLAHLRGEDGAWRPPTWAEMLDEAKRSEQVRKLLEEKHQGQKCQRAGCHGTCLVKQVKNDGKNHGRWYLICEKEYRNGHTYEWLDP